jgi:predicted site-specific integrase-resolvase
MSSKEFVGGKEASSILGVHQRTLYQWENKNKIDTIRTPGGKRLYNIQKFINENKEYIKINGISTNTTNNERKNICYIRVSSLNQKNDLERQREVMKKLYPKYEIIEDIGSGLNLNKRGIRRIIKLSIEGKINELVIAYKDRLTRFGFDLIENIIKEYSNGRITILNKLKVLKPEEELVSDVMALMNVYVAKMNGLRRYKTQNSLKKGRKISRNIKF